jgi:hypothetical protein
VLIGGTTVTVKVAHIRLCHSRMLFVRAYPREPARQSTKRWSAIWQPAALSPSSAMLCCSAAPAPASRIWRSRSHGPAFYTVVDLVNRLESEARAGRQGRLADYLTRMDFVVLDELGYLPFAQTGGQLLFHLISRLYERTSIIVTTGGACLPTGANRGGTACQARCLKRQLSLPVSTISQ